MIDRVEIEFETGLPRDVLVGRLASAMHAGPFVIRDLVPAGPRRWSATCVLAEPAMAVGSGKVAELQYLLAREVDLIAVRSSPATPVAVT